MLPEHRRYATGECIMLRKLLLPMLATAALAGCATDYQYRGGNGDYYYGQPRVEYRHIGPSGFYGGVGFGTGGGYGGIGYGTGGGYGGIGYGATYFYDRYGRLVYGYPRSYYGSPYYDRYGRLVYGYPGGYYRSPYYGGSAGHHRRPAHGHGDGNGNHGNRDDHDGDGDNQQDRTRPRRELGQFRQIDPDEGGYRNRGGLERLIERPQEDASQNALMRMQRSPATAPAIRQLGESPPRMGGVIDGDARPHGKRKVPAEE